MKKQRYIKGVSKKRNLAKGKDKPATVVFKIGDRVEIVEGNPEDAFYTGPPARGDGRSVTVSLTPEQRALLAPHRTRRPVTNDQLDALQQALLTGRANGPDFTNQDPPWEEAEENSPLQPLEEEVPQVGSGSFVAGSGDDGHIHRVEIPEEVITHEGEGGNIQHLLEQVWTSPEQLWALSQRLLHSAWQERVSSSHVVPLHEPSDDWTKESEVNNLDRDIARDKQAKKEARRDARRMFYNTLKQNKFLATLFIVSMIPAFLLLIGSILELFAR